MTSVMVVEDDADLRSGIELLLDGTDFEIVGEAPDARRAVRIAETERPDVVVLDYRVPGATGKEIGTALKEIDPEIKVLVFSAYAEVAGECNETWADFFLLKTRIVDLPTALLYLASDPESWGEPFSKRFEARR